MVPPADPLEQEWSRCGLGMVGTRWTANTDDPTRLRDPHAGKSARARYLRER